MFTEDEIKTAKATRDEILQNDTYVLKSIYMAGEICMWDEMRTLNIPVILTQGAPTNFLDFVKYNLGEDVPPFDKEDYEKLKKEYQQFHNQAAEDMQEILWEIVEDEINGVCNEYASNSEVTSLMNTLKEKFIISKK